MTDSLHAKAERWLLKRLKPGCNAPSEIQMSEAIELAVDMWRDGYQSGVVAQRDKQNADREAGKI